MKLSKVILTTSIALTISLGLSSCGNVQQKDASTIKLPSYSKIIVLKYKQSGCELYSLRDNNLYQYENNYNISNIEFNSKGKKYIYTDTISIGNNLVHNNLRILSPLKESKINDSFSYSDIVLSPDGTKFAYRSYKHDSIESAEGMRVYDINKNKNIDINSGTLVSGQLYNWLSDDKLLYYGIPNNDVSGKLLLYDFKSNTETPIIDKFNGYCVYFKPLNSFIVYLEKKDNENRLCIYNINSKKNQILSMDFSDIWDSIYDRRNNILYFIASKKYETGDSVYSLKISNNELQQLTYDFPNDADKSGGIAVDEKGNLIFCGIVPNSKNNENDIYMFNFKDNSINLIYGCRGNMERYHLISDKASNSQP